MIQELLLDIDRHKHYVACVAFVYSSLVCHVVFSGCKLNSAKISLTPSTLIPRPHFPMTGKPAGGFFDTMFASQQMPARKQLISVSL